jgi:hypothetical protein
MSSNKSVLTDLAVVITRRTAKDDWQTLSKGARKRILRALKKDHIETVRVAVAKGEVHATAVHAGYRKDRTGYGALYLSDTTPDTEEKTEAKE